VFQHDCCECLFLGTTDDPRGRSYDLYVCAKASTAQTLGPSLIARYGNEGPEYISMPWKLVAQTKPRDLPEGIIMAHDTVVRRIFTEFRTEMQAKLESYRRELVTPRFLASMGSELTYILRCQRATSDTRWLRVFDTMHFKALDAGHGNVEVFLTGGAG
jgi:hypothetical protein